MRNPTLVLAFPLPRNRPFHLQLRVIFQLMNPNKGFFPWILCDFLKLPQVRRYGVISNKQRNGLHM